MPFKAGRIALGGCWWLALAGVSWPAFGIQIQSPVVLEPGAPAMSSLMRGCDVERRVGSQMLKAVQARIANAREVVDNNIVAAEPHLRVTIRYVQGAEGGSWSGPKSIGIRAELWEEGQLVAKTSFRDFSNAPFSETCEMIDRIARSLGSDVASWLSEVADTEPASPSRKSGPRQHAIAVPPASSFAPSNDIGAVPLRDAGKARYQHYLTLPSPKAFAISEEGSWRLVADDAKAIENVLNACVSRGHACWLYAVDDQVVWHPEPGRRVGKAAPAGAEKARQAVKPDPPLVPGSGV